MAVSSSVAADIFHFEYLPLCISRCATQMTFLERAINPERIRFATRVKYYWKEALLCTWHKFQAFLLHRHPEIGNCAKVILPNLATSTATKSGNCANIVLFS